LVEGLGEGWARGRGEEDMAVYLVAQFAGELQEGRHGGWALGWAAGCRLFRFRVLRGVSRRVCRGPDVSVRVAFVST